MIKKLICAAALLMVAGLQHTRAQYVYGTTGLLHAPSADMQRDKTFLCGFSYLQVAATPKHWNYDTWNYYINIHKHHPFSVAGSGLYLYAAQNRIAPVWLFI